MKVSYAPVLSTMPLIETFRAQSAPDFKSLSLTARARDSPSIPAAIPNTPSDRPLLRRASAMDVDSPLSGNPSATSSSPRTAQRSQRGSTTRAVRRPSRNGHEGSDDEMEGGELRDNLRRVAHSAVEKRRREKIKDKVALLRSLVPTCAMQPNLHKLTVLEHTIDYIYYLRKVVYKLVAERERIRRAGPPPTAQGPGMSSGAQQHNHIPTAIAHPRLHHARYMQFDVDIDDLDLHLLFPPTDPAMNYAAHHPVPPQPTQYISRHSVNPSNAVQEIPVYTSTHRDHIVYQPMGYSAPASWPLRQPRRLSADSTVSSTTPSPVYSPSTMSTTTMPARPEPKKETSPMRVDNLLC
ncbi:uncharacterized protein SPPG_04342 [Spizellomyces punctatus DAOM BR117]|uniref:BHLH domain-containing protein n=1 Tax=Spizellomyces punctatus (strain DAOM BR117) TaxID=645134 RepID=A0A0L0HFZ4_SPIPD|nr:uncharacterized protein SPPG_04342 [Spizellomyces punctatus DAOM BR117]KNC99992.1 hypothetical protein SPPG_04342 [Spizellomyces punctatus DAOM BR117]|eukprot:XP_016608032.1 hypothetical protein SPPG_04342 [Spizellomyces punctatus DAOM BR117]